MKNNKIKKIFVLSSFSANLFILYISIKMKTNLTSQISLKNISAKYYRPENAFEKSVLTRFEKVPTDIYESVEEGTQQVALEIAQTIRNKQKEGRFCVLALPGGNSPRSLYAELVRMHEKESLS